MSSLAAADGVARDRAAGGWLLVAGVVTATLTDAVAGTALSFGRLDVIGDTHATPDEFAWLDIAYTGLKLIGFVVAPWLLTRLSLRTCLLISVMAIGATSGLAMLTSELGALFLLRAVQGFAGAAMLISGQAMLFRAYPQGRQPIFQALFAFGAVVAPATAAPALQGWLIDSQSWSWIFFSVAPISLAAAGLILASDDVAIAPVSPRRFDWLGTALISTASLCLTYVLFLGNRWNWFEAAHVQWLTLIGAGALALFVAHHVRGRHNGSFDRTVFQSEDFAFAFLVSFVAGAALLGSAYLIPSFAQSVLAFTPTETGELLLASAVPFALTLLITAFLVQVRRVPPVATAPLGILLFMSAMWLMSGASGESGSRELAPGVLLRGFGLGFLFLSITLIAFSRLPPENLAYGIGLFNLGRQSGGLVGVAALQTLIDHQVAAGQAVLGANLTPGIGAVSERIASTAMLLTARGVDAGAAVKASAAMLGRAIAGQATVIAFDSAFKAIALLFVIAAPVLVTTKIILGRAAKRRAAGRSEPA